MRPGRPTRQARFVLRKREYVIAARRPAIPEANNVLVADATNTAMANHTAERRGSRIPLKINRKERVKDREERGSIESMWVYACMVECA